MTARFDVRGRRPGLTDRRRERDVLDQFMAGVRAGEGRALVVRGEPGVGKTALLDYLAGQATGCRVLRAAGVETEMEVAFAGLHQLCRPMLEHAEALPVPQREALRTVFGVNAGPVPDRFLVGLAVLGLLSEAADERPLVCVVDDVYWLDQASVQTLGFAARRLAAEPVGVVFATRIPGQELAGVPELVVEGLAEPDARELLTSVLTAPLDARVRDQILAETRGNPLALLELPRGLTPAQLAGGFGLPGRGELTGRIEDNFGRQIAALPDHTRSLLQLAAADPSGNATLVRRAAQQLGIPWQAGGLATELVEFGSRVVFRHPLVRSAAYRSASVQARREAHGALAEVTDAVQDPDRRAWHRAQAALEPDEEVASELERSAARAQARGGLAAAAAFLERAATLTPEESRRARRMLAAAQVTREAGTPDTALALLNTAAAGPLDELQAAQAEHLRGQIAFDQRQGPEAVRLLFSAARRLEPLDPALARETHLEALLSVMFADDLLPGGVREAAEAARAAPPAPGPPQPADVMLDALALLLTEGYPAAATALSQAVELQLALGAGTGEDPRGLLLANERASTIIAMERCDFESLEILCARQAEVARDLGALVHLRTALNTLATMQAQLGDLGAGTRCIEEDRLLAEATGTPVVAYAAMMCAAWRGQRQEATAMIEACVRDETARGQIFLVDAANCSAAVLGNGLSQYEAARDAAWQAWERQPVGLRSSAVAELAEAAARTGKVAPVLAALEWLAERTLVAPTAWALGIEARVRALLADGEVADLYYRLSIEHLDRSKSRGQLGRAHLLYGEWLRRENRRKDARVQLRIAYDVLSDIGAEGFAERARRELAATGETVRRRTAEKASELTVQETHIARLAVEGKTNPEIGAQLFLSARTVEWHLRKVFTKLGVGSRRELHEALALQLSA